MNNTSRVLPELITPTELEPYMPTDRPPTPGITDLAKAMARRLAIAHVEKKYADEGILPNNDRFWFAVNGEEKLLIANHYGEIYDSVIHEEKLRIARSAKSKAEARAFKAEHERLTHTCPVCSCLRVDDRGAVRTSRMPNGQEFVGCQPCTSVARVLVLEAMRSEVVKGANTSRETVVRTALKPFQGMGGARR